jgi:Xaa-Pro aminopeptidase
VIMVTAVQQAQEFMAAHGLDAWLVYEYQDMNPTFEAVTGPARNVTRPVFALVSASGTPVLLAHAVDIGRFDLPGWNMARYTGHEDLHAQLRSLLFHMRRVAMEYSPNAALPRASRVDAGTIELVRSLGPDVVPSADLLQYATQRWSQAGLASHRRAADALGRIVLEAFQQIGRRLDVGVTEHDIAEFIRGRFAAEGLWTDEGPVVAANDHASDPHFDPTPQLSRQFQRGDWVLIDLWARDPGLDGIYADITWTAYLGNTVPAKQQEVFRVVTGARDAAVEFATQALASGRQAQGWEVDRAARQFIARHGYGDHFTHRTGHSLGRTVHAGGVNMDDLETHDTRSLIPGLGFTIEPGVYLPEFGVRSEIDLYVGERGLEVTTPIQHDVVLVG